MKSAIQTICELYDFAMSLALHLSASCAIFLSRGENHFELGNLTRLILSLKTLQEGFLPLKLDV